MWGDPVWSAELRGDPRMDLELALDLEHATICCTTWDIRVGWSRNLHIDSHKSYHRSQSYQNRNLGHTYYLQYIYISLVIARITWRWPPSNISVHSICYCRWSYQPHALQPNKKSKAVPPHEVVGSRDLELWWSFFQWMIIAVYYYIPVVIIMAVYYCIPVQPGHKWNRRGWERKFWDTHFDRETIWKINEIIDNYLSLT